MGPIDFADQIHAELWGNCFNIKTILATYTDSHHKNNMVMRWYIMLEFELDIW